MKNKVLTKITKAYDKKIKQLNKNFTHDLSTWVFVFIEQLKYLRDMLILKATIDPVFDADIATLVTAISEFEASQTSEEDSQKCKHWNNFWETIKLSMGEWLALNDTI